MRATLLTHTLDDALRIAEAALAADDAASAREAAQAASSLVSTPVSENPGDGSGRPVDTAAEAASPPHGPAATPHKETLQ